jgi:hypothetical protein
MTNSSLIDPAEVERLIQQAKAERAEFTRTFMRNNTRRIIWTMGTASALYLAVLLSFHHI